MFGVTRPGGSALSSTQVGALRAAQPNREPTTSPAAEPPSESRGAALFDRLSSDGTHTLSAADILARRAAGGELSHAPPHFCATRAIVDAAAAARCRA